MADKPRGRSMKSAEALASEQTGGGPVLLSGGNPQIPKGDGDAPVQAYIAAMPGWKSAWEDGLTTLSCAPCLT